MFVCGGENVYPGDVEGTLERHPDILQAAVLPVDHELKGQVPVAFVVARAGSGLSEQAVKEWALAHGPAYQHPRRVFLVSGLRGPCRPRQRSWQPRRVRRHRRHRRCRGLRPPRSGPRPRGARARQLGLFPRPGGADATRADLKRPSARCGRSRTAPPSPCAWSSAPTGRKRSHKFHRIMTRSAAKLSYEQAQAAIDGRPDETHAGPLSRRAGAALRRARGNRDRARTARPARSRSARAQARSRPGGPAQGRALAGAAGGASADRGIHDPRQCRRRRVARGRPFPAHLSRPRRTERREAQRSDRISPHPRRQIGQGRARSPVAFQSASSAA